MGIIQSTLNQTIGTVGVAARLSPGYETRQELHKLGKQEAVLKKEHALVGKNLESSNVSEEAMELGNKTLDKIVSLRERQFELDPTEESFSNLKKAITGRTQIQQDFSDLLKLRQKQALKQADSVQEARLSQKQTFKNYPKDLQKTINLLKGRDI